MVKKTANAEPSSKLSASELAASILRQAEQDRQLEQAARLRDLAAYREVMAEAAETTADGRGLPEWSNMMAAARILADRLGYCADSDLSHLDALAREAAMIAQHGSLPAREQWLNSELSKASEQEQELGNRHIQEREQLRQHFRETGRLAVEVGQVQAAARTARGAVGHLTDEVQA